MSRSPSASAAGCPSGCVGIWFELDTAELAAAQGDERIRLARGLVQGLDAIPEVESVLVPCLPSSEAIMGRLFGDATQPDRLMSAKLRLLPVGKDPVHRDAVANWLRGRGERARSRLSDIGATTSPRSWPGSIRRVVEQPRRPFAVLKRIVKLVRLSLMAWVVDAGAGVLRALPSPHASVAATLRRWRVSATWFLVSGRGLYGRRLLGPKIVDGCHFIATANQEESMSDTPLDRLARGSAILVAPSRHAAAVIRGRAGGLQVSVVTPAPLPAVAATRDAQASRRLLADELRGVFSGGDATSLHRHFCDFPFERVEYLVAVPPRGPSPILPAYAAVLRRHRRNLKLVVDGLLPRGDGPVADVHSLGLSFDVAEAAGLPEPARARLLRHARAVIVPDLDGWCLPPTFAEAVAAGTPVVLGRSPAVREVLPDADLSSPEYFDVGEAAEESLVRAILHVLDHGAEVIARQVGVLDRLVTRTWRDVAAEHLKLTVPG